MLRGFAGLGVCAGAVRGGCAEHGRRPRALRDPSRPARTPGRVAAGLDPVRETLLTHWAGVRDYARCRWEAVGVGVLYVVVCAAPAASDVRLLVSLARVAGWRVVVVATPDGARFVDRGELEALTGEPVRSAYRTPDEGKALPLADAVVVAPATFNTVNKWAAGIADNFAVALLCELTGFGVPILGVPLVKDALARHPAFRRSLDDLRAMGVRMLFDPEAPKEARMPPWERILTEVAAMTDG